MADEKLKRDNVPLKNRSKRRQLISSATSLSSLFGGLIGPPASSTGSTATEKHQVATKMGKKSKHKDGPQKERWLLTRKTWKYMTDAGRRLIPETIQHRGINSSQDISKIEDYFQQVCRREPKFLPWRRKQSYPGAMGTSIRRSAKRRTIASRMFGSNTAASSSAIDNRSGASSTLSGSYTKPNSADESEDDFGGGCGGDENHKMFLIIRMLEKYLNITDANDTIHDADEGIEEQNDDNSVLRSFIRGESSPTSPTYSVLSDEDTKFSPGSSAAEDNEYYLIGRKSPIPDLNYTKMTPRTSVSGRFSRGANVPNSSTNYSLLQPNLPTNSNDNSRGIDANRSHMHTSLLLESLRNYSRTSRNPLLSAANFTSNVLPDKQQLRRIRDELKQQQLERIFRRYGPNRKHEVTSSMITLPFTSTSPHSSSFDIWRGKPSHMSSTGPEMNAATTLPRSTPPKFEPPQQPTTAGLAAPMLKHDTDTIQVPLIAVKSEKRMSYGNSGTQTDPIPINLIHKIHEEYIKSLEKIDDEKESCSVTAKLDKTQDINSKHSRRKSSIDNEDVSQSVSDTIKRYLRMARKKTSKADDANRFKRINYDTNLRNIKPKSEIPHPEELEFENNNKQVQTNDDWINILMIEYNLHMTSQSTSSPAPSRRNKLMLSLGSLTKPRSTSSSPYHSSPPSPSPVSKSISQTQLGQESKSKISDKKQQDTSAMQKSKSSSNVGQVFSRKIWKSRSKSQIRPGSPVKSHWAPQGNSIWITSNGRQIHLKPTKFQDLSEIERKTLQNVAMDRINQLNIGVAVRPPNESEIGVVSKNKAQKRRAPLLLKRKALTTSFFDSSKTKNDENKTSSMASGLVFGQPLEKCLSSDISNLAARQQSRKKSERCPRGSIASLIDNHLSHGQEAFGSCESLFGKQEFRSDGSHLTHSDEGCGSSLDEDDSSVPSGTQRTVQQHVPPLVLACIEHLTLYGLNVVGIFRVSTSKRRIRELREGLDRGILTSFDAEISPHDVASLLKEYLRDLPEPLLCRSLYPAFLATQKIRNRRLQLEALSHIIQLLPLAHRDTLFVLLKFLAHVARHADDVMSLSNNSCISIGNKMDSANLATVIAPNILHCNVSPSASASEADERLDVINVIRTMIDHYEEIFIVPADVMNDVYTAMMDSHPQQLDYICDRKEYTIANRLRTDEDIDGDGPLNASNSPSFQKVVFGSLAHQIETDDHIPCTNKGQEVNEPPRRIYVREEFTHENSGKVQPDAVKRRERTSKMRYQQPEQEVLSRRRRRDRSSNASGANDGHENITQNYAVSPPATPTRKMAVTDSRGENNNLYYVEPLDGRHSSATNVSRSIFPCDPGDSNQIVTASLKLPVQMTTMTTLNLSADILDIPFIEDEDGYSLINAQTPLRTNKQSSDSTTKLSSLAQASSFSHPSNRNVANINEKPPKTVEKSVSLSAIGGSSTNNSYKPSPANLAHSTEPKLTASIMNIGGDVLRSKTANFERMLLHQSRRSSRSTPEANANDSADVSRSTSTSKYEIPRNSTCNNPQSITSAKGSGPIYKRRDVISSAQSQKK